MMAAIAAVNNMGACAHNPRGNLWFNDETTYGHKLLMKMGWSKGKGLGKNEDGIKENLSVKFKSTNSGLGYKDDPYANIMKTEYESILKSLSTNYSKGTSTFEKGDKQDYKNCEQRSKVVKGRPRYPKLFFGKDVTKYSEKDMKSIFICSLPSKDNQEALEDSAILRSQEPKAEFPKETKTSALSISDYFAKKMKEKKVNILPEEADRKPSQHEAFSDSEITITSPCNQITKKRKRISEIDKESFSYLNEQQTELIAIEDNVTVSSKKKSSSKKKRKLDVSAEVTGSVDMHVLEPECVIPDKKKLKLSGNLVFRNDVSEKSTNLVPEKKGRKSEIYESKNNSVEILTNGESGGKISCQIELSSEKAIQLKKKLRKYDKKSCISTTSSEPTLNDIQIMNSHSSPKSTDGEQLNSDVICPVKKKKSKKKKFKKLKSCLRTRTGNYCTKNVSFNENVSYRVINSDHEFLENLSDECSTEQKRLTYEDNESENNTLNVQEASSCNHRSNHSDANMEDEVLDEELKTISSLPESSGAESQEEVLAKEVKDNCSSSSLPSPDSSYYNPWIESQRQALKMKMYKSMLKSIKKHEILKTSNLLSIKGYGNWGF